MRRAASMILDPSGEAISNKGFIYSNLSQCETRHASPRMNLFTKRRSVIDPISWARLKL
jgi:hypothetical protein